MGLHRLISCLNRSHLRAVSLIKFGQVRADPSPLCCRVHSLLLKPPLSLSSLAGLAQAGRPALVATKGAPPLPAVLQDCTRWLGSDNEPCMLVVGPEGDFTDSELEHLIAAGVKPVGLGQNRLRVETAAIAMVAGAMLFSEDSHQQQN